jgi:hypothetical protein
MTFGFIAKGDNGALLASSDSANYEFAQRLTAGSVAGNVTTYTFSAVDYPMFFIEVPIGGKAGILDSTNTQVRIIGDGAYPVNVFKRVSSATGFGVAAFDSSGALTFKAGAQTLNVKAAGAMGIGGSFTGAGSMVSFPALASRTLYDQSDATVFFSDYVWQSFDTVYSCTTTQDYQIVGQSCTEVYYGSGSFICFPVYGWVPVTTCGYTTVTTTNVTSIYATVRTTNWYVQRSVARRVGVDTYVQDWVTHTSGYYKDVVGWQYYTSSFSPFAPPGYVSSVPVFFEGSPYTGASGVYTKNNAFPYSNGQMKSINATILTS